MSARLGRLVLDSGVTGPEPRPVIHAINGMVESLDGREILGWVDTPRGFGPVRVALYLNDLRIGEVQPVREQARRGDGRVRRFRFRLRDVWLYCGPEDRLQVQVNGWPLPMNRRGMFYRPVNQGTRSISELRERLARGWVFASNGVLNQAKTTDVAWQDQVTGLYSRVRRALVDIAGYEAFLIYGSLLGLVREQGFINHDFDLDAAYVSTSSDPAEVAAELVDIGLRLIEQGFQVDCHRTSLHIHDEEAGGERIDLFHLYFDGDGVLRFPWGVAGSVPFTRDDWSGVREAEFARTTVLVPERAEKLVAVIYGKNWRTPNPGFSWERERTEAAADARVTPDQANRVNWEDFWARAAPLPPTPFASAVLALDGLPTAVLDLGCGDGRDSALFADRGRRVLGLDLSSHGLAAAERRRPQGDTLDLQFASCDLSDREGLRVALRSQRIGVDPVLVYGRFLLHALTDGQQRALLEVLDEECRVGDVIAFEFRGLDDATRPKQYQQRRRRFVDASALDGWLAAHGWQLIHHEEGTGLAQHEIEDPYVHRIVARRSAGGPVMTAVADRPDAVAQVVEALEADHRTGISVDHPAASDRPQLVSARGDGGLTEDEVKVAAFALIDAGLTVEYQPPSELLVSTDGSSVTLGVGSDEEAALSPAAAEEIYWANFYAHTEYSSGSTFFDKVVATEGVPRRVIDLGCGDGRDSYAFAAADRSVLGIDRSHIGVAHASRKAAQLDHAETARFVACDVSDVDRLRETLSRELELSGPEPVLFYARFFLHSIPESVQEGLMDQIRDLARSGDWFAAEFRTDQDAAEQKVHQKHYRRFQNGPAFGERVHAEYGFEPVEIEEGRGLSPYRGEDPHLYRIIARRP